jgi:hypothetical protein
MTRAALTGISTHLYQALQVEIDRLSQLTANHGSGALYLREKHVAGAQMKRLPSRRHTTYCFRSTQLT